MSKPDIVSLGFNDDGMGRDLTYRILDFPSGLEEEGVSGVLDPGCRGTGRDVDGAEDLRVLRRR